MSYAAPPSPCLSLSATPSFEYPTTSEYANAMSQALAVVTPQIRQTLSPPIQATLMTLGEVFEQVSGSEAGQYVIEQAVEGVKGALTELASGVLGKGLSVSAGSAGADEAAGAVGMVVMAIAKGVMDAIAVHDNIPIAREKALELAKYNYTKHCLAITKALGTDIGGTGAWGAVTPSDLFRQSALRGPSGQLPATVGAMYLVMCGGEVRGMPGPSRAEYENWLRDARAEWGPQIGISLDMRRRMAVLIEAIMASIQRPSTEHIETAAWTGDQGRTMMPILTDLLLQEQKRGRWTRSSVKSMWTRFVVGRRVCASGCVSPGVQAATSVCMNYCGDCSGTMDPDGGDLLFEQVVGWAGWLRENEHKWREKAADFGARAKFSSQILRTPAGRTLVVVPKPKVAVVPAMALPEGLAARAALALGVAGLSYGVWTAVRLWGPRP